MFTSNAYPTIAAERQFNHSDLGQWLAGTLHQYSAVSFDGGCAL